MVYGLSSAMPFISCRIEHDGRICQVFPATYFMSGVCPIEVIAQSDLCEQAPMVILYNHFCMAELLPHLTGVKFTAIM